jgi:hypothetical protein
MTLLTTDEHNNNDSTEAEHNHNNTDSAVAEQSQTATNIATAEDNHSMNSCHCNNSRILMTNQRMPLQLTLARFQSASGITNSPEESHKVVNEERYEVSLFH